MVSFRQRTALLAFGMVFIIILFNAIISYRNVRRLRETDAQVRRTFTVISSLQKTFATLTDAETGQRGFIITFSEPYLEPYQAALDRIDRQLEELQDLVADNPSQRARVEEFTKLARRRLTLLDEGILRRREQGAGGAEEHLASGRGKALMDDLRAAVAVMELEERNLLEARNRDSESAYSIAIISGVISTVFGLLLAVAAYVLVVRDVQQQSRARLELQAANDLLEERVQQRTETIHNMISNLRAEIEVRQAAETAAEQAAEELQRSNRELELFASVASHDLQEPLRKIQAFADRLELHAREQLGEKGRDYLDRILTSASRMRRLIDDLLAYSRVTTKGQALAPVDLNTVVAEVINDLEGRLQQTGGRIEVSSLPQVEADPTQMRQLFQNLLANGLKFHRPEVAPEVTVTSQVMPAVEETGPALVEFQVRDRGIGFEPVYKDRIFQLFQRLHGRDGYEGTGIGLAICKKIVERHGGTIIADSAPGEGTVFTFTLPLAKTASGTGE